MASNVLLTAGKLVVGVVTGSVAVLSEAASSAGDLVASAIAFAGVRAPRAGRRTTTLRPREEREPGGRGRGGPGPGRRGRRRGRGVQRLVSGAPEVAYLDLAIAVLGRLRRRELDRRAAPAVRGAPDGSPAIAGDAAHLASDVWTSAGTAAGLALVALTGWTALDAIVALGVAAYVVSVGARLVWAGGARAARREPARGRHGPHRGRAGRLRARGRQLPTPCAGGARQQRLVDLHMVVPPRPRCAAGTR